MAVTGISSSRMARIFVMAVVFSIMSYFVSTTTFAVSKKTALPISSGALSATSSNLSPTPVPNPILNYTLDIKADSAIVVEVGRGMKLYLKNANMKSEIPVASKIMTAVIALETLPLDTKITVSKVAADAEDASVLYLRNGEKYSLEYLLYGILLTDNDAAAIAISEQISGEEAGFVKLMNSKALSYKMENTVFTNVTGQSDGVQYTTVSDVARLVRFALTLPKFDMILKTKDIPFFLSTNQTKHLFNNLEQAWSLVDTTTGALLCDTDARTSFVTTSISGGINIITIANTTNKNSVINDISIISNSIFSDYELSTLVMENQPFPKSLQIGSDIIELKFNQEITYVHPKDIEFLGSALLYEENAIVEYPILATKAVAKVIFELLDGTKITADLYPARTVWGETSMLQKVLLLYNSNRDIGLIILMAIGGLIGLCIYNFIKLIYHSIKRHP